MKKLFIALSAGALTAQAGFRASKELRTMNAQAMPADNQLTFNLGSVLGDVGQGITLAGAFVQAVNEWENVNFSTGDGILQAVQESAQAVDGTWNEINTVAGGSFNQTALNAVAAVAGGKFPTATIVNDSGKLILTVAGQATDITTAVQSIRTGVESSNWGQVLPSVVEIAMQLVGDVQNDVQLFNIGSIFGDVGQGISLVGNFVNAVNDWENVNFSTGNGILQAVQVTAQAVDGSWSEINSITGGSASQGALNAVSAVAGGNFPTATIVNDSGRFILTAAGQSVDVTTEVNNISSGVQAGNWGLVLPNVIQLSEQIVGDVSQIALFNLGTILGDVGQGVTLAQAFVQAVNDWENVNFSTGAGILSSVQETASAVDGTWNEINTVAGGSFNQDALNAVAAVAGGKFPTATIVNDSGKLILTVAGQATDITTAVQSIRTGVESSNWGQVLPSVVEIAMQLVGDVQNDVQFVDISSILNDAGQAVTVAQAFYNAVNDWENITWSTGAGILQAVQESAQAVDSTWADINNITGGSFNQDAFNAVAKVAGGNFPTAKIVNVAGKMIMTVAGQATDITTAVQSIRTGVETSQWGQVLPSVVEIAMQMVGDVQNAAAN